VNLDKRSYEKELLDREDIPFADIKKNMEELDFINRHLGGHAITLKGLHAMLQHKLSQKPVLESGVGSQKPGAKGSQNRNSRLPASDAELFQNPISILEIGCGGGNNLRVIKKWAAKKNIPVQLTGVDISEACIRFANAQPHNSGIEFICADYKTVSLRQDVIFSSLFCHHFTDDELVHMLRWMRQYARIGFFINDLHRHPAAYYSIKMLTTLFSKSYLVRHDAPLSVRRGFTRGEWHNLFQKAMLRNERIRWMWAFRWLITCTA
jgi:2-polyprenyl-3-methyl-5-hydroxy-6-metoxy-1,4-benzoquinol methylase